jgi:hypothetical protein
MRSQLFSARSQAMSAESTRLGWPGTHADARLVLGDEDGVRLDRLADAPGEEEVGHLGLGGLALGGNGEGGRVLAHVVELLDQEPAVDGAHLEADRGIDAAGGEHAEVLAPGEALEGLGGIARCDEDLDELLVHVGEVLDQAERHLSVHGDDAAERGDGIAGEGVVVGRGDVRGDGRSAGVLVLEDDDGRVVELADGGPGGVGVEEVVVGELLALELPGRGEAVLGGVGLPVEGGLLLRVLSVAQVLRLGEAHGEGLGELGGIRVGGLLGEDLLEVARDRAVVGARGLEHLEREPATGRERGGAAVGAHLGEDGIVVRGIGDDGDRLVVLGGGAQHRGAADVDVLDGVGERDVGLGDGLLELVEVHADEVDHLDAVGLGVGHVRGVVATAEQPAMHLGMERLHTPAHHLGEARVVLDVGHVDAGVGQDLGSSPGRDDLDAELALERLDELDDATLVGDGHERPLNGTICHWSSS